jgi:hypothetical protein
MSAFLIFLSSAITVGTVVPYILNIYRDKTKPRIVSWATWTVLTGIACAATIIDKQYPAAMLMLAVTIESLLVVILGWKYGDRKFARIDNLSVVGALIGFGSWFIFSSPEAAVLAIVAIEFIGMVPTAIHSWEKPFEETSITFLGAGCAALLTLWTVQNWQITSVLYPMYICIANIAVGSIIVLRQKYAARVGPAMA